MAQDSRLQARFDRDGFAVVEGLFSSAELAPARRAFERLARAAYRLGQGGVYRGSLFVTGPGPGGRVRIDRVVWCGAAAPTLLRLGEDPRLLRIAASLLGSREMHQLINQAHFKLPGDGVEFPWHQDSAHRRFGQGEWTDVNGRGSYVQSVLAIDDMAEDNGPLEFLPGSGRLGHVGLPEGTLPAHGVDPATAVRVTARAGSVVFFGPYTFHRSEPNRSDRPRRVLVNGYAYPGANSRKYPGRGAGRLLRVGDVVRPRVSGTAC